MMRNTLLTKIPFLALLVASAAVYGIPEDFCDADILKSVEDLQAQIMEIKGQYASITSNLERIQLEIPRGLQNFPDIFNLNDQNLIIGPDGNIYFDHRDLRDYVCVINSQSENASDSDTNNVDQTRSGYVTTEQFNQLADLVFTLSASCQTLRTNLQAVSNTVSSISHQMSMTSAAIQDLNAQCEALNQKHATLDRVIDIKEDGRLVLRLSPLLGNRESEATPFLYQYPSIWSWNKICSKFNVATNSYLQSITLYCSDASKTPLPQSVYVSTGVSGANGDYQFCYWYCNSVNTNKFPLCTYSFANPILIRSDRFHTLGIRKIGDNLIYPYVCSEYRNGGLYKPYGASEAEPLRDGSDPSAPGPRQEIPPEYPSITLEEFMNMTFAHDWEHCVSSYEIWSVLNFVEDIDFAFSEGGLAMESGKITVGGSEVVTSSNLSNMFVSVFSNNPNITWDMFCQELKTRLITTAGGTVTGPLNVYNMKFSSDADWKIGDANICSDIVFLNPNSRIRSNSGSLKLSASQDENISAESFLSFDSMGQAGIVTIPEGQISVDVGCDNLTSQAIILLTPRQPVSNVWWSVQNNQNSSNFTVKITRELQEDISFNYVIIRK